MSTEFENEEREASEVKAKKQGDGFSDPDGSFPRQDYWYESGVNSAARNQTFHKLKISNGIPEIDIDLTQPIDTEYPLNQVRETVSGHVLEFNDTMANERILLKHATGAGVEMRPDGTIVVNSKGSRVEIVDANHYIAVEGDGHMTYYGNLSIDVSGDLDMNVGGDFYLKVGGSWIMNILGDYRTKVVGYWQEVAQKARSITTVGNTVTTTLGSVLENVKGKFSQRVKGDIEIFSGANQIHTAESEFVQSSPNTTITSRNLAVIGTTGTIGGDEVIMYNRNSYSSEAVHSKTVKSSMMTAVSYNGDLNGTARAAVSANVSAGIGGGGHSVNVATVAIDEVETERPTAVLINDTLDNSSLGIRDVAIDETDHLKNSILKSEKTQNVTDRELDPREVRAKLKDSKHLNNADFIQEQFKSGSLNQSFANPVPSNITKTRSATSSSRFESEPVVGNASVSTRFKPRETLKAVKSQLTPDPEFNPETLDVINQKTKLARGLPISKFMNGTIELVDGLETRRSIVRNLQPHVQAFTLFKSLNKFEGFNLTVAEGVYIKGANEELTQGEFLDLSTQGRAIAYEVYDLKGVQSSEKTFEFAEALKDFTYFEEVRLNYDTFDPSGKLNSQVILITPEISSTYEASFSMSISTYFNGKVQSARDFVEIQDEQSSSAEYEL